MAGTSITEAMCIVVIEANSYNSGLLKGMGYDVRGFADCPSALGTDPDEFAPSAVLVQAGLAFDANGISYVRALRQKWPFAPLLAMADEGEEEVLSDMLASGACDFMVLPMDGTRLQQRLMVRISEFHKRSVNDTFAIGDITVDAGHRFIYRDDRKRALSPTEMSLLQCLATARGTIVNREVMKKRCWGQPDVSDNALNRKLHEVRRALSSLSAQVSIKTIYGTGFLLEVKEN